MWKKNVVWFCVFGDNILKDVEIGRQMIIYVF